MPLINMTVLMGRLTAAPERRYTESGVAVCSFAIAVERDYTDKSGARQADFINCQAWRGTAEFICKYFDKGSMLALVGKLQARKYTDKQGNARTAYEVVVDSVSFAGGRKDDSGGAARPSRQSGSAAAPLGGVTPASVGARVAEPQQQSFDTSTRTVGDYLHGAGGNLDEFAVIDDGGDLPF